MIPPSGRVPKQSPNWFSVAIEACGGGTSDLGYFLEVWAFIGEVGVENKSGGPTGSPRGTGACPKGVGTPSTIVGPLGLPSDRFLFQYFLYFPKKSSLIFSAFRELLFLHKDNTTVVLLKTTSIWVSFTRIKTRAKALGKVGTTEMYQLPQA